MNKHTPPPLHKSAAKAFGWLLLAAAISTFGVALYLVLPVITEPESNELYRLVNEYINSKQPGVLLK